MQCDQELLDLPQIWQGPRVHQSGKAIACVV